jgi:uroporphyrinogen decarboxylase
MRRRAFIKTSVLGSAALLAGGGRILAGSGAASAFPNKRERMLAWLEGRLEPGYTPAAFFVHFDEGHKLGSAAAAKHLEYFSATGMDFVKVQYEREYTPVSFLKKPSDWSRLSPKGLEFYEPQLEALRQVVKAAKRDSLVLMTLYSPFMWAGHSATLPVLLRHMEEDPGAVKRGLDTLVESQLVFVRACIKAGVDGFYMATQGSETGQLSRPSLFRDYVKPADLVAMREASSSCPFNIVHVCDYNAPYSSYDAVLDYPGQVVSCCPHLTDGMLTWQQVSAMFKRPGMGGMERHGVIYSGSPQEIRREVRRVVAGAPRQFILGADCTVPGDIDWRRIRTAIDTAHGAA